MQSNHTPLAFPSSAPFPRDFDSKVHAENKVYFEFPAEVYNNLYAFCNTRDLLNLEVTSRAAHRTIIPFIENNKDYKTVMALSSHKRWDQCKTKTSKIFAILASLSSLGVVGYLGSLIPKFFDEWDNTIQLWPNTTFTDPYKYNITCADYYPAIHVPKSINQCTSPFAKTGWDNNVCVDILDSLKLTCIKYGADLSGIILISMIVLCVCCCVLPRRLRSSSAIKELPKNLVSELKQRGIKTSGTLERLPESTYLNFVAGPVFDAKTAPNDIRSLNQNFFRRRTDDIRIEVGSGSSSLRTPLLKSINDNG